MFVVTRNGGTRTTKLFKDLLEKKKKKTCVKKLQATAASSLIIIPHATMQKKIHSDLTHAKAKGPIQ